MIDSVIELLPYFIPDIISALFWRKTCPHCHGRLKWLLRGDERERVQCVMCERVWMKGKGWQLRPDESTGLGLNTYQVNQD